MTQTHRFKRPESVLIIIYTSASEVLLMRRIRPQSFWQSVTGSMRWDEQTPAQTARRELCEETGLCAKDLAIIDCHTSQQFPIKPAWQHRFAADVRHNIEHVFRLQLVQRMPITLNPKEHSEYVWLARTAAADKTNSYTNRDAILQFVPVRE